MISLERERSDEVISPNFHGDEPRIRLVALMKQARKFLIDGDEIKLKIDPKWRETKEQLLKESRDKCAYCESHFSVVTYGDVEHYRPKSVYWWLAYVYDNYLASCAICNQRFKGAKFFFSGPAMRAPAIQADTNDNDLESLARTAIPDPLDVASIARFRAAHADEAPLIPNPYFDDPESVFAWDVIEGIGEVIVTPRQGVARAPEIVAACEEIYGLNRPQLKRRRFGQYKNYRMILTMLDDLPDDAPSRPAAESFIASMREPASEYAGMIRYLEDRRFGA